MLLCGAWGVCLSMLLCGAWGVCLSMLLCGAWGVCLSVSIYHCEWFIYFNFWSEIKKNEYIKWKLPENSSIGFHNLNLGIKILIYWLGKHKKTFPEEMSLVLSQECIFCLSFNILKKCELKKNFRKFESFQLRYFGTLEPGILK